MTKTQINIIKKAQKENFTIDQIEFLESETLSKDVKYYFELIKKGFDIKDLIYLKNDLLKKYLKYKYNIFDLLQNNYTIPDIINILNCIDNIKNPYRYFSILKNRSTYEEEYDLRKEYAYKCSMLDEMEELYQKVFKTLGSYFFRLLNFSITNKIPFKEFFDYCKQNIDQLNDWNCFIQFINQNIPYINLIIPDQKTSSFRKLESNAENEINTLLPAIKQLYEKSKIHRKYTISNTASYERIVNISDKAIDITLYKSSGVIFNYKEEIQLDTYGNKFHIIIFHDGACFYQTENKYIRLTLKKLSNIYNNYGNLGKEVVKFICQYEKVKLSSFIFDDIYRTIEKDHFLLLPIYIEECKNQYNLNQLLRHRWINADLINWNKTDINLGYLIIKSIPLLEKEIDKKRLLQLKNTDFLTTIDREWFHRRWCNKFLYKFLAWYCISNISFDNNIEESDYNLQRLLYNYMVMLNELHKKIRIGFKSPKKIKDAHDKITLEYRNRLHKVHVPKNSKFVSLNKILPNNFTWIKTGKRLRQEGIDMGHCVNSYYEEINNDECAIYSCIINNTRYTIEFRINRNKYYIEQIQLKYDRGCPKEIEDEIKALIA